MSDVISFRLNKDNLREAKALMILHEWKAQGYSIRQTITEALVNLDRNGHKSGSSSDELNNTLIKVNHLLKLIGNRRSSIISDIGKDNSNNDLSTSFVASVKRTAKAGLKLD